MFSKLRIHFRKAFYCEYETVLPRIVQKKTNSLVTAQHIPLGGPMVCQLQNKVTVDASVKTFDALLGFYKSTLQ